MRAFAISIFTIVLIQPCFAQCFNRSGCDPSVYEIRSQLTVTIPLTEGGSAADTMKELDEAQHKLSELSARQLDNVKAVYGATASLRTASSNSNMQENGSFTRTAFVSITNTYAVKKPIK